MAGEQIDWSIVGAEGQPILGTVHVPYGNVRALGAALICHGFKGYKDYGFIPYLADHLAQHGLATLRFNFSHNGFANNLSAFEQSAMFERTDLFERDTYGKQITDLTCVLRELCDGGIPGIERRHLPIFFFGHSRGGVTALLATSRLAEDPRGLPLPSGVIIAATPADACGLSEQDKQRLHGQGYLESPSSRTGQVLRIGRRWLREMELNPAAHNPVLAIAHLPCPALILHGEQDQTVSVDAARTLAEAAGPAGELQIITGASHTFNAPNPMAISGQAVIQTDEMTRHVCRFVVDLCRT